MREIKYFCDCCTKEIEQSESCASGIHPIFGDYTIAASQGKFVCLNCRPQLNSAASECITKCTNAN